MKRSQPKRRMPSVQIIALSYVCCVLVAALLLSLPVFHRPEADLAFIDALFTAASAVSVTGLTVIPIHEVFNQWGILLLTLLFQIGGIGIMTLGAFYWLVTQQKIGLEQRMWIATDHNQPSLSGLVKLIRNILLLAIYTQLAGTVLLGSYFLARGYYQEWYTAYFHGFFTAVSAFTNAGFDLFGTSLIGFSRDYGLQLVIMVLIICGAIGFPVLMEGINYLWHRRNGKRYAFSLFAKITTVSFFSLIGFGTLFFLLLENDAFLRGKSWHESLFYALFQSVSTRSGGMATMEIGLLSTPTLVMLSVLMFIGASPNSAGGGIRTTTFFVLLATVFSYMRGHKNVRVFGRELMTDDIMRSFLVFFVGVSLVLTALILLLWLEQMPVKDLLFEVCSAFGTTGLSTGITARLSAPGKLILIIMMVIGRIGIISLLLLLKREERPTRFRYPKERIIIGQ